MYRILNVGRAPFFTRHWNITSSMIKEADERLLNGEPFPTLQGLSKDIEKIVLKACSYTPQHRYQSADEMSDDLREYERNLEEKVRRKSCMNRFVTTVGKLD